MTNGEYIRSMADEELAEVLILCRYCSLKENDNCDGNCHQHIKEWLGQERKCEQE